MGVKNNFSQAVSELIGITRVADQDVIEPEQEAEDAFQEGTAYIDDEDQAEEMLFAEDEKETIIEEVVTENKSANDEDKTNIAKEDVSAPFIPQNPNKEKILAMLSQQPKPAPGTTTIARGTVIIGEINAEGDVELLGSVKGKISSQGNIMANGKVIGDLIGRDIELNACAVQGNIISTGMVTVDGESVVIGDVKSENICLDGKIKGNVVVEKEAKFQPKAILAGNVTTASIAMSQGAKIQGSVNIPLSEKETNMSFDLDIEI